MILLLVVTGLFVAGQANTPQRLRGLSLNLSFGVAFFLQLFLSSFGLILGDSGSDAMFVADASLVSICRMYGLYTLWCVDSFYTGVSVRVH